MGIFAWLISIAIGIIAQKFRHRSGWTWGAVSLLVMSLGHIYIQLAGGNEWIWTGIVSIVAVLLLVGLKPLHNSQDAQVECPFCAEKIKPKAAICRHCGKTLPTKSGEEVASSAPTQIQPAFAPKPLAGGSPNSISTDKTPSHVGASWKENKLQILFLACIFAIAVYSAMSKYFAETAVDKDLTACRFEAEKLENRDVVVAFGGGDVGKKRFAEECVIASRGLAGSEVTTTALAAPPASAAPDGRTSDLPRFEMNENYTSVRTKMIGARWTPFHAQDSDECAQGDARCAGRPEMNVCAGTGMANCKFLWKKNEKIIAICTVGEGEPTFADICAYTPTRPVIPMPEAAQSNGLDPNKDKPNVAISNAAPINGVAATGNPSAGQATSVGFTEQLAKIRAAGFPKGMPIVDWANQGFAFDARTRIFVEVDNFNKPVECYVQQLGIRTTTGEVHDIPKFALDVTIAGDHDRLSAASLNGAGADLRFSFDDSSDFVQIAPNPRGAVAAPISGKLARFSTASKMKVLHSASPDSEIAFTYDLKVMRQGIALHWQKQRVGEWQESSSGSEKRSS